MTHLDIRTFDTPDEELSGLEKVQAQRVDLGSRSAWKFVFEPGWRYTEHFEPNLCSSPHVGYVISGRLAIAMANGASGEAGPGSVVTIDPGHDAWTVGDEACVFIDFGDSLTA